MYSFEGDYKSSLVQSLGKKQLRQKDELVADAQQKRMKREQMRLENRSTIKIQACYRSYRTRMKEFANERAVFLAKINSMKNAPILEDVETLFRSLNFFFTSTTDDTNMVSFCVLTVKYQSVFKEVGSANSDISRYHVKKWLRNIIGVLQRLSGTTQNIAMALRVLEIFLDEKLYKTDTDTSTDMDSATTTEDTFLDQLYQDLVTHGYFKAMRTLCDDKIPGGIEMGTSAPTPLASSLLALILKPLIARLPQNSEFRSTVLRHFCASFMSPAYTHQVCNYILPSIQEKHSGAMTGLIHSLKTDSSELWRENNSTLLHSLMLMIGEHVHTYNDDMLTEYLSIITEMFPSLSDTDTVNFENDPDEMDWGASEAGAGEVMSLSQMRAECLQIINSPSHVARLMNLCKTKNCDGGLLQIAKLCHTLTSKLGQRVHANRLLYTMAFDNASIRRLWSECLSISVVNSAGNEISVMQILARGLGDSLYSSVKGSINKLMCLLSAFSSLFYHSALTLHDTDFRPKSTNPQVSDYVGSNPFSREEIVLMVSTLRDACLGIIYLAIPESKPVFEDRRKFLEEIGIKTKTDSMITKESYIRQRSEWIYLFKVTSRLTKHLYIRDTRTHFCSPNHWLSNQIIIYASELRSIYQNHIDVYNKQPLKPGVGDEEDDDGISLSVLDTRRLVVLTELPFVVPFEERVQIFHNLVMADRVNYQTGFDGYGPMSQAAININIRRDYVYEDAFEKLSPDNEPSIKPKVRVNMKNNAGLEEAGIDGGGIFREFLSELLKTGFDPNRGFFKFTASDDKMLYPNPEAHTVHEHPAKHFFFLGRMLGKALYENMLIEIPFAGFFLTKILGKTDSDFHQLSSLDPTLYKSLLFVKNYSGDVTDLGLDFSVVNEVLGVTSHVELKPNGKDIVVNNNNCIEYVHLMADYKLNKQIRAQCHAFTQGLEDIIKLEWLRMFNHHELQLVISGTTSPIDVNDLRVHAQYSGAYTSDHPTIVRFWNIVYRFSPSQRSSLLKFVTSCSRSPLLGFKNLYPAFCIHHGGDEDRLPTASTCMNFLKLPDYPDDETMRSKLLYAIESGAGFELS